MRLEPGVVAAAAGALLLVGLGAAASLGEQDARPVDALVQEGVPRQPVPELGLSAPVLPTPLPAAPPTAVPSALLPPALLPTGLLPSPLLPTDLLPTGLVPSPLIPSPLIPSPLLPSPLLPSPVRPTPSSPVTVPPGPPWVWPAPPAERAVATAPGLRMTLSLDRSSATAGDVVTATTTIETSGRTASFDSVCSTRPSVAGLHVDLHHAGPGGRAWTGARQAFKVAALSAHGFPPLVPAGDDAERRPPCTTVTLNAGTRFVDTSAWVVAPRARSAYDGPAVVHGTLVVDGEAYELSRTLRVTADSSLTAPGPAIDLALSSAFGDFVAEGGTAGWVPAGELSSGPSVGYAPDFPAGGRFYLESILNRTGPRAGLGRASVWSDTGELRQVDVP